MVHLEARVERIFRGSSSSSVDKVILDISLRVERWVLVSSCLTLYLIGKLVFNVGGRRIREQPFSNKKKKRIREQRLRPLHQWTLKFNVDEASRCKSDPTGIGGSSQLSGRDFAIVF